jgi:hypothetical protein
MEPKELVDHIKATYHHDLIIRSLCSRAPSQREAEEFPPKLVDDGGGCEPIGLKPEQIRILLKAELVYFCEDCTRNTLGTEDQEATYHTSLPLDQVPNPEAYLQALVVISQRI